MLSIHSPIARHLDCFQFWTITNKAAKNILVQVLCKHRFPSYLTTQNHETIVFLKILFLWNKERSEGGEREGEKHQCDRETSIGYLSNAPIGGQACNPGMCPEQESNQQPLGLWDDTQPTEPHQSGQNHPTFVQSGRAVLHCRRVPSSCYMFLTELGFLS